MMSAYLIVLVRVTNPEQYENYKALTPAAVAAHEGEFIVRGGDHQVLEGPDEDRRLVVVEFPSMEKAQQFYDSPEYGEARAARAGAAEMEVIAVSGA